MCVWEEVAERAALGLLTGSPEPTAAAGDPPQPRPSTPPPTTPVPRPPAPPTREVGGERGVDEHQAVQVPHVLGHRERPDRVKHPQRVALFEELADVSLVE